MPGDHFAMSEELLVGQPLGRPEVGMETPLLCRAEAGELSTIVEPDLPEVSVMVEIVMARKAWHRLQHDPGR